MLLLWVTGCEVEDITDFGFDSAISGTVKDQEGNIVAGHITSNNLVVQALGEGDEVTTDMRVKGDGTYQNTKLYPKKYKIWISGPVTLATDTLVIDFSQEKVVMKDLIVIPFVTINQPVVVGSPTLSTVDINYDMIGNEGKVVSARELYCSTNPYPDASTGSGSFYETKTVALAADEGSVSVTDLAPKTKYYIRIGAKASGASGFNYSEQIVVTTQ
jgi:hypothetical protein